GPGLVEDAAPAEGGALVGGHAAVGDRQAGDAHRGVADVEDAGGAATADDQLVGARPVDLQVVGDAQLAAAQADGAVQPRGDVDYGGPGVGVGGGDRLPQRADAAVGQVANREGAGHYPVFQGFQPQSEARRRSGRRGPTSVAGRRTETAGGAQVAQPTIPRHG